MLEINIGPHNTEKQTCKISQMLPDTLYLLTGKTLLSGPWFYVKINHGYKHSIIAIGKNGQSQGLQLCDFANQDPTFVLADPATITLKFT